MRFPLKAHKSAQLLNLLNSIKKYNYVIIIFLVKHNLEITLFELQIHLDNANSRLQKNVMEIDELCEIICKYSAKSLMELFQQLITTQEDFSENEIRKLICVMWVLHDLGMIRFAKRADGLAITIQEMLLSGKKVIASKLMSLLEDAIEYLSDDKVSILYY